MKMDTLKICRADAPVWLHQARSAVSVLVQKPSGRRILLCLEGWGLAFWSSQPFGWWDGARPPWGGQSALLTGRSPHPRTPLETPPVAGRCGPFRLTHRSRPLLPSSAPTLVISLNHALSPDRDNSKIIIVPNEMAVLHVIENVLTFLPNRRSGPGTYLSPWCPIAETLWYKACTWCDVMW